MSKPESLVSPSAAPNRDDGIIANEQITARFVTLISESGVNCGELPIAEARRRAAAVGLSLVQLNKAIAPTVKICDLGLYRYNKKIAERAAARAQRNNLVEVKEVQLSPTTQARDIFTIAKKSAGFLKDGNKVKIVVRFEGRQLGHTDLGRAQIDKLVAMINTTTKCTIESPPVMSGDRSMHCVVVSGSSEV